MPSSWVSFVAVFVAEPGDTTRLAARGHPADASSPWGVLAGSAAALVLASRIAVVPGRVLQKAIDRAAVRLRPPAPVYVVVTTSVRGRDDRLA